MTLPFLIIAIVTLAGAGAAMTMRRTVHCALLLTIALAGLAALYLELDAQFVGLTQILVYVGAVAILIVFAILLTRGQDERLPAGLARHGSGWSASVVGVWVSGGLVVAGVFAVLAWSVVSDHTSGPAPNPPQVVTRQIGDALMQRFILPLEIIGLMLTAALIGAAILAVEDKRSPAITERRSPAIAERRSPAIDGKRSAG